jgi:parvulin-like peptidyl-prolyl isomerase
VLPASRFDMRHSGTTGEAAVSISSTDSPRHGSRRAVALLLLGVGLGALLAAAGLLMPGGSRDNLPAGVIARVNGEGIRREDHERMLAALAGERREDVPESEARRVLDRLIEEELLVQRGIALGLARKDRRVRSEITAAMIASVLADLDDRPPSEAEIEDFYANHRDFFLRPGRLRIRQIFFRVADRDAESDAMRRAAEAERRLQGGEDFGAVRDALGDPPAVDLPSSPLPPSKLRDYLGPTLLRVVLDLAPGEISLPVRSGTGVHLVEVLERQPGGTPHLDVIREEVAAEVRRRAGDEALRAYLDGLRAGADVVIGPIQP